VWDKNGKTEGNQTNETYKTEIVESSQTTVENTIGNAQKIENSQNTNGDGIDDKNKSDRKIMVVKYGDIEIRFKLVDSVAANQLYNMLQMAVEISNYDTMSSTGTARNTIKEVL